MEIRASYVAVGVFTLLAVVGALVFVLWTARSDQGSITPYNIYFRQGVSGLSIGNDVLFNGVRVGQVSEIKISPEDPGTVRVRIDVASDTPVRDNSVANLEPRGLTGLAVVAITGGTADSPLLAKAAHGRVAVIPSKLSGLQTLMATAPNLLVAVNQLMDRANDMLSPENARNLTLILDSTAKVAHTVSERRESLDRTLGAIEEAAHNFARTSRRIDALAASAQKLVDGEFSKASQSVDKAASRLDSMLSAVEPGVAQFSREGLDALQRLLAESRNLMNNLSRLAQKIESDPRRFFFGNPVPEYTP